MNKEQQDKLWNDLSAEDKAHYQEQYVEQKTMTESGVPKLLEDLFGSQNLNSKHRIRTWEDVEKVTGRIDVCENTNGYTIDDKVKGKVIATAKIAKLIELGYGGMVTEEEWEDEYKSKWVINCDMSRETRFEILEMFVDKFFIAFHEESQAKEFMSYESNRKLVEQYNMM